MTFEEANIRKDEIWFCKIPEVNQFVITKIFYHITEKKWVCVMFGDNTKWSLDGLDFIQKIEVPEEAL